MPFDPALAPRYPSPALYRPELDRVTLHGKGSVGDVSSMHIALPDDDAPEIPLGTLFNEGAVSLSLYFRPGDADDTAAIQRAHDDLPLGGIVELPGRDIIVGGQVRITNTVRFRGKGWSEKRGAFGTRIVLPSTAQSPFFITGTGTKGVAFTNLSIVQTAHPVPAPGWKPAGYPVVFDCQSTGGAFILDDVICFGISKLVNSFDSGRTYLHRVYGHIFDYLLQTDKAFDAARIDQIHLWPFFADDVNVHAYTTANLLGLKLYRCDTPFIDNFFMIFGHAPLWFGDAGNGSASRIRAGKIQADGCAAGVIVDASASYVDAYIADLDVQGVQAGTTATGVTGGGAIQVGGNYHSIRVGHLRAQYTGSSAIVLLGQGNRVDVATPYLSSWGADGTNPNTPAVFGGNSAGLRNAIRFGSTPRLDQLAGIPTAIVVNTSTNAIFDGFPPIAFTPVITATSGTLGSYTASGTYRRRGAELSYDIEIAIGNNGTGAGGLLSTLPDVVADAHAVAYGSEFATSGLALTGRAQIGTQALNIVNSTNGYPATTGSVIRMKGRYTPVNT